MDSSENESKSPTFAPDLTNVKTKTHGNKQNIYYD